MSEREIMRYRGKLGSKTDGARVMIDRPIDRYMSNLACLSFSRIKISFRGQMLSFPVLFTNHNDSKAFSHKEGCQALAPHNPLKSTEKKKMPLLGYSDS